MKILAIEFSSRARGVAACDINPATGRPDRLGVASEEGDRSSHAVRLAETALREAGIRREEITHLAVGLGPGSHTGIRAALAFVLGWQLGGAAVAAGVSSVEVLAAQACLEGLRGEWNVVIDAQRGKFYLARYEIAPEGPALMEPLRIAPEAEIRGRAERGEKFLGPDADRIISGGVRAFPTARVAAELAWRRGVWEDDANLAPINLRETQFVKAPPPGAF
jgi:tRNA threonylcarbamoyladenosine biosynthesis protein TsaB